MPIAIALLLTQLGCAPSPVAASNGTRFVIWVCPPVAAPAEPAAPDEREG